jgi:hypothetical protein
MAKNDPPITTNVGHTAYMTLFIGGGLLLNLLLMVLLDGLS